MIYWPLGKLWPKIPKNRSVLFENLTNKQRLMWTAVTRSVSCPSNQQQISFLSFSNNTKTVSLSGIYPGCPVPWGYQISWQSWLNPDKKWPDILTFPVLHLINYRYQTGDSWCAQEFEVPLKENQVPLARKVPQVTGLSLVSQKFQSKTMNLFSSLFH